MQKSTRFSVNQLIFTVAFLCFSLQAMSQLSITTTKNDVICNGGNNGSATANPTGGVPPYTYFWSPGAKTTQTITGLTAGSYSVTLSDTLGANITAVVFIYQPAPVTASASSNSPVNNGGALNLFGNSNDTNAIFSWNGPNAYTSSQKNPVISFVNTTHAGTYSVTAMSPSGCASPVATTTVSLNGFPLSLNKTDVTCFGANNGSATANPSGGTAPYTYYWSPVGISAQTANGLAPGSYTVTVTDFNALTSKGFISINQPGPVSASASTNSPVGVGDTLYLFGNSNDSSALFSWNGPNSFTSSQKDPMITFATTAHAGTYTVTAMSPGGCSSPPATVFVDVTSFPVSVNTMNVTCYGFNNGSATANPSGGTPPYTYLWSPGGQTSQAVSGLYAGNYTVTVTDAGAATVTAFPFINQPPALNVTTNHVNATCGSCSNGSASANVAGGSAPYTFNWSTGDTMPSIAGKPVGNYSVTVTDFNGCVNTASVYIDSAASCNLFLNFSHTNATCGGCSNGSANVTASNGVPPYAFSWSSGETTASVNGKFGGTYSCTVTDVNGCSKTDIVFIDTATCNVFLNVTHNNATCGACFNGSAYANASNGTPPYNFMWSSGDSTSSISGKAAGNYSVTVTDWNGCTQTSSVFIDSIGAPCTMSVTITHQNSTCGACSNGSATANISGGTPPYTFNWSSGDSTMNISGKPAGNYSVMVTDWSGCTSTAFSYIDTTGNPCNLNVTTTHQNATCGACSNGSANANVSGGTPPYTFNWSSGDSTMNISGKPAGNYSVTVTDFNGCTMGSSVFIDTTGNPSPVASFTANDTVCPNIPVNFNDNSTGSPTSWYWQFGDGGNSTVQHPTHTYSAQGTYNATLMVTNGGGSDTLVKSITVSTGSCGFSVSVNSTNPFCFGASNGSATANATGGSAPFTYLWNNGATTQTTTGLAAGNYTVTVTDGLAATSNAVASLTQPVLVATTASSNSPVNVGSTLSLSASSNDTTAYNYSWSGPNGFTSASQNPSIVGVTTAAAGTYSVNAMNANGCTSTAGTTSVTINPAGTISVSISSTNIVCNGGNNGSASATPSNGTPPYTFMWSNGMTTQTVTGLVAGNYSVTVTDNTGGTKTAVAVITQPGVIFEPTTSSNSPVVLGDTLNLFANAADSSTSYHWSGPNGFSSLVQNPAIVGVTTAAAGTYSVYSTNASGCNSMVGLTTVVMNTPTISVSISSSNVICNGGNNGSATATPSNGTAPYTYSWTNGGSTQTITGLVAGNYSVTVSDAVGATKTAVAAITEPAANTASISGGAAVCEGQSTSLSASVSVGTPPYAYSWNTGGVTQTISVSPTVTTTYSVLITDANGCTVQPNTSVTVNPIPAAPVASSNSPVNNGQTLSLSASTVVGVTYTWSGPNGFVSAVQNPTIVGVTLAGSGTYSVHATTVSGCVGTDGTTSVVINPAPTVTVTSTNVLCFGGNDGSATVNAASGTPPYSYSWTPSGQITPTATSLAAGIYTVTVTDATATSVSGVATVTEPGAISVSVSNTSVLCNGGNTGSATAAVAGGTAPYVYSWSNGQTAVGATALIAGTYTITVTDANGCSADSNTTVTEPAVMVANVSVANGISCNGVCDGSVTAAPAGGTAPYNYLWMPGNMTAQTNGALCPGNYSVTVTDANGCTTAGNDTINQPSALSISVSKTDVTCNGSCNGTGTATPNGGTAPYSFYWSNGEVTQSTVGFCVGSYDVFLTDANGCIAVDTVTITEPLAIPISVNTTPPSCGVQSGSAVAIVTGPGTVPPITVLWNTGDTTFTISNLGAGSYRATVKDGNGCLSFKDALINNTNGPTVTLVAVANVTCHGTSTGSIDVNVTGGSTPYTYAWSNGKTTEDISNLSYGPYEIVVSDASACSAIQSFSVSEPAPLSMTNSVINSSCPGSNGSASVVVSGGRIPYTYAWSSGAIAATANSLSSGTYTISVIDSSGCIISDMIGVSDSIGPVIVADTIPAIDCGSAGILALNPQDSLSIASFQWNTGSTTQNLTNVTPGNYGVVVTDTTGCKSALVVPVKPALPPLRPICLVTVDTLTGMNLVVWEKPVSAVVAGFNIYRESSQNGIYQKIGYVPYSSITTFYDSITNPADRWAKYKVSMNDVCGAEGPFSPEHKTIHFSMQSYTDSTSNLIWDDYVGDPFSSYFIYRKYSAVGVWTLIDSVPSTVNTYQDTSFIQNGDSIFYLVDVPHNGGDCIASLKNPTTYATTVKSSKSNQSERLNINTLSVPETASDSWLKIYPNPNHGMFTVQSSKGNMQSVMIYNMLGELQYNSTVKGQKTDISVPELSGGIYQVRIVTDTKVVNRKIVISK